MKTLQFYYQCWVEVAKQNRYQDKWLTDETYFRAIKAQFPSLDELGFDRGIMNRAISVCGGAMLDDFTTSNTIGIFRRKARGIDPFSNQCRMIWGYYVTTCKQMNFIADGDVRYGDIVLNLSLDNSFVLHDVHGVSYVRVSKNHHLDAPSWKFKNFVPGQRPTAVPFSVKLEDLICRFCNIFI